MCEDSMALEDFFTLTEMKDGLVASDRVEELVSAMKKEKDSAVKSVGETARQWSTVAQTLAATENRGILKHFIELGGLFILDQWLQEAQQFSDNTNDSSVEESTCELLGALEKLPIDNEMPVFSGVMVSIKNLIGHKSSRVQERAKALFDWMNLGKEEECDHMDIEKDGQCQDEVKPSDATISVASISMKHAAVNVSAAVVGSAKDRHVIGLSGSEVQFRRSSGGSQSENAAVVETPLSTKQNLSEATFSQVDENDVFQIDGQVSSLMSTPLQPSLCTVEESSVHPVGETSSVGTCSSPVTVESNGKTSIEDVIMSNELGTKSEDQNPDKFPEKEIPYASSSFRPYCVSSADTHAQQLVVGPAVINDVDVKESEFCAKKTLPSGVDSNTSTVVSNPSDMAVVFGLPNNSRSEMNLKTADQKDGIYSNVSLDISVTGCTLNRTRSEANDVKELPLESVLKVGGSEDSATIGDMSKPTKYIKASEENVKSRLDMELDFGEDDALEVARLVAKEVEREVVDYREPLCSSSSKRNSEDRVIQPGSPDSVNGEQDQPMAEPQNKMPAEQNFSGSVISTKSEDHLIDVKNMDRPENSTSKPDMSQVTGAAAQEPPFGKSPRGFDLNEESYSEEMDHLKTIVSSSITAASTPKAELELPDGPTSCFEGNLRRSGSATTNAFGPTPILRIPEAEKVFSVEGSSNSKQRQDFLDIDLNVAGGSNDGATETILAKIPLSSGLPSGESSVEVSSIRAKRLKWDLNCTGDRSPSPVSSSPSKQPAMRSLDLNDNPSLNELYGHPSDHGASSSQGRNDSEGLQVDGPCISIFGTRVPLNSDIIPPQTRSFLPNGPVPVSSLRANYPQSVGGVGAIAYMPPSPGFGYNGPHMEAFMSLSPAMYGSAPGPYTLDPRETPMAQQIMGSSMAVPPSYSRSPFPMSMTGAPSGFNWIGPSQPSLDQSSGWFTTDVESREPGTSRQGFIPGQANMMEEQMGSPSQTMNSGMRLKRREPDNGCDPYLGLYRRQPPWR